MEDYWFSFDLKSAHHHFKINEEDRKYLGFKWKEKNYVFNGLPLGLNPPYIFLQKFCVKWSNFGDQTVTKMSCI